jgi:uncharacterized membrane protein YgaE (UPF0421/DUF939 family)
LNTQWGGVTVYWLIIGGAIALIVVIIIIEIRGAMDRTEEKLEEMHKILLQLQESKDANVEG